MVFLKVKVIDKHTIQLEEDGKAGDRIDLTQVISVDQEYINNLVNSETNKEVNERIKKEIEIQKKLYEAQIEQLKLKLNNEHNNEISNIKNNYDKQLQNKEIEINKIKNENEFLIEQQENLIQIKFNEKEKELNEKINELKNSLEKAKLEHDAELVKVNAEHEIQLNNVITNKSRLNVKQIGGNLEDYCDNEVKNLMQNGLDNCIWFKDTKSKKGEDDDKATKADFILKIYASDKHIDNELLTSICFEMKDEDPTSQNKKQNKDHFNKLDNDRKKAGCVYAVLVSNLERDKPNDLLIYKVTEYPNMYVVRPEYLTVFINMIVSLNKLHASLLNKSKSELEQIKQIEDVINDFEKLKDTYLDKPLEQLSSKVNDISKQNDSILSANQKINEACNKIKQYIEDIQRKYIETISEKLNKFSIKIQKQYKKTEQQQN